MEVENSSSKSHVLEWGETVIQPKKEVDFSFTYYLRDSQHVFKLKFNIPLKESIGSLTYRIIASHSIPCYLEDGKSS